MHNCNLRYLFSSSAYTYVDSDLLTAKRLARETIARYIYNASILRSSVDATCARRRRFGPRQIDQPWKSQSKTSKEWNIQEDRISIRPLAMVRQDHNSSRSFFYVWNLCHPHAVRGKPQGYNKLSASTLRKNIRHRSREIYFFLFK